MPIYVGDITNGRRGTVLQSTGSTWFGNSADDSHNMQGTLYLTGALHAYMGMSGSHTKTFAGTSYLVAGSNVTITSASNGQITIASSGGSGGSPAGSDTNLQYNNGGSFGGASRLLYDDTNGRLGIGVTPSTTLHVYADASSAYVTTIDNDAGSAGHGLKVTSDGTGSGTNIFDVESASTTIFRVRGDGRVGLGKVSSLPAAKLTVSSSNSDSDLAIAHKIHHIGDSDTNISFDTDEISFTLM